MDREFYRSLTAGGLTRLAREQGINAEMAIVLAEKLDGVSHAGSRFRAHSAGGTYRFNQGE